MTPRLLATLLAFALILPPALRAAINPAAFIDQASHALLLRERARTVHEFARGEARLRRVTVVAEVVQVRRGAGVAAGDIVMIDYTVDLTAREAASRAHAARPPMPGPQFMGEPDPPAPDAQGRFWAALVRADSPAAATTGKAGAVRPTRVPSTSDGAQRDAGDARGGATTGSSVPSGTPSGTLQPARSGDALPDTARYTGPVFVPAAGPYSWWGELIAR